MKFKTYNLNNIEEIPELKRLTGQQRFEIIVAAQVIPYKTNNYIIDELINWNDFKNDPVFALNFPSKDLLENEHFEKITRLVKGGADKNEIKKAVYDIWLQLNPYIGSQLEYNIPELDNIKLAGIQHKYNETLLFFPTQGQTCHAYCTFCFRWPQLIGNNRLKFAANQTDSLIKYLRKNEQITDILITGGDPMVMSAKYLRKYIDAILNAELHHVTSIRIGSKALSYWPYRFISDSDSSEILDIFRKIVAADKHLAFMAHFNHPVELSTEAVKIAARNILDTGAVIRSQSPILNHINASAELWIKLWKDQVNLGIIPYYMFIPRDTGAQNYFALPLVKTWEIFREAYSNVSGLCRTVRGPSMSTNAGKIQISGVMEIFDEKVIMLNFLQARDPKWTGKPFLAKYDKNAIWIDELKPAFGQKEFFYEKTFRKFKDINDNIRRPEFGRLYNNNQCASN